MFSARLSATMTKNNRNWKWSILLGLTEVDWIAVNKVRRAYERGAWDVLWSEFETFGDDLMLKITGSQGSVPRCDAQGNQRRIVGSRLHVGGVTGVAQKDKAPGHGAIGCTL